MYKCALKEGRKEERKRKKKKVKKFKKGRNTFYAVKDVVACLV